MKTRFERAIRRVKKNKYGEPERDSGLFSDSEDEEEAAPMYNNEPAVSNFDNRAQPAVVSDMLVSTADCNAATATSRSSSLEAASCTLDATDESPSSIAAFSTAETRAHISAGNTHIDTTEAASARQEHSHSVGAVGVSDDKSITALCSSTEKKNAADADSFQVVLPSKGVLGMSFMQGHNEEVRVTIVRPGGHAATADIQVGMCIRAINGILVTQDGGLNRMLLSEREKGDITLTLSNGGKVDWQKACSAAKAAQNLMVAMDLAKQQKKDRRLFSLGKKVIKTAKHKAKMDRTTLVMPVTYAHRPMAMEPKSTERRDEQKPDVKGAMRSP